MIAVEIELARERLADLVDDGQLGIPLADLGRGAAPFEGSRDVPADEGQEPLVLVGVASIPGSIALDREDADGPVLDFQRNPKEIDRDRADGLQLAGSRERVDVVARSVKETLGLEDVPGQALRLALPERHPLPRVGPVGVDGVDVEREADLAALLVEERDVAVLRVQQLAQDRVDPAIELLHVGRPPREVGDLEERGLGLRGARLGGETCLELRDATAQLGGFW